MAKVSGSRKYWGSDLFEPAWPGTRPALEIQSAALPYRVTAGGDVEFLLVTTRRQGRWGLPKGSIPCTLSMAESAAREAYEEAGVIGEPAPLSCTSYRKIKRRPGGGKMQVEVWVYPLLVTKMLRSWPEQGQRLLKWCGASDAAALLGEADFGLAIRRLCRDVLAVLPGNPRPLGAQTDRHRQLR